MNPVEIWEGIDTHAETGRIKLAIHILSVVANSAGCEHAFRAIRSKLSVEKVQKATIVGMDLKRMHLEAGLVRAQAKETSNFSPKLVSCQCLMMIRDSVVSTTPSRITLILISYLPNLSTVQLKAFCKQ